MELVRGIPITEYCDQGQLSTGDRLELFIKVCQAVQHAHQKGTSLHRNPPGGFERRRAEYHRASKYLADLLTHEEYIAASRGTIGEFWDAQFLVGVRKLVEGRRAEGLEHIQLVTRIRRPMAYTYEFARVIPGVVERETSWPPGC